MATQWACSLCRADASISKNYLHFVCTIINFPMTKWYVGILEAMSRRMLVVAWCLRLHKEVLNITLLPSSSLGYHVNLKCNRALLYLQPTPVIPGVSFDLCLFETSYFGIIKWHILSLGEHTHTHIFCSSYLGVYLLIWSIHARSLGIIFFSLTSNTLYAVVF